MFRFELITKNEVYMLYTYKSLVNRSFEVFEAEQLSLAV